MIRKKLMLTVVVLIFSTMGVVGIRNRWNTKSFAEITNEMTLQVCTIQDNNGNVIDEPDFMSVYGSKVYRRYSGQLGNTARRKLVFLNSSGEILFTMTDLGNRCLIELSINGKSTIYQYDSPWGGEYQYET